MAIYGRPTRKSTSHRTFGPNQIFNLARKKLGTNFDIRVELVSHKGLLVELLRIES